MNICYISNSHIPSRTANSIHVMKMCQAYGNLGHEVTLVVPEWRDGTEPGIQDVHAFYGVRPNFEIRKVFLPPWHTLDFFHRAVLMPILAFSHRPSLVHSRSLTAAWGMTKLLGMPTVLESHQPPSTNSNVKKIFQQTIRSGYLRALAVITNALADRIRPLIPENIRLLVAPDGVDSTWLRNKLSIEEARAEIGLGSEKRRLAVYAGHLYTGRGIGLLIDLARKVKDHYFLIVGGSESDIARFRNLTEGLENLEFVGFKPPARMFTYLRASDVLLMPYRETIHVDGGGDTAAFASPMKMFEYMAVGRPILASTLPVLKEVLKDGVNAMLLPCDQLESWADALRRLAEQSDFAKALAQQARLDVEQYTWENRAQRFLEGCAT